MGHFERNFRGKEASPTNDFGTRKVESLGYRMVKKIAEKFNRLSRVHQRHRQTDRRQTTDGIAMAYSKRNVIRSRLLKTMLLRCNQHNEFTIQTDCQILQMHGLEIDILMLKQH